MITFYPRDIPLWRKSFTFGDITLSMGNKRYHKCRDRAELTEFLKQHGVRLDDHKNPLEFRKLEPGSEPAGLRDATHTVVQFGVLGWLKDDLC